MYVYIYIYGYIYGFNVRRDFKCLILFLQQPWKESEVRKYRSRAQTDSRLADDFSIYPREKYKILLLYIYIAVEEKSLIPADLVSKLL